jgi:hypothetical protein
VNALPGGEIVPAMDRGLLDAAEFNNASSDRILGFPDVSKVCMLQSFHQNAEQFEIMFNKDKYNALPRRCARSSQRRGRGLGGHVVEGDRPLLEGLRRDAAKQGVKFYKTPTRCCRSSSTPTTGRREEGGEKRALQGDRRVAEGVRRARVQWDMDNNVNRRMAYNHYFGAKRAAPAAPRPKKDVRSKQPQGTIRPTPDGAFF